MKHTFNIDQIRFAELSPQVQDSYQNGIQIATVPSLTRFTNKATPISEFLTHSDSSLTRQFFTHMPVREVIALSQTSQFFYRLYNQMFPRLEIRLTSLDALNKLSLHLQSLKRDQSINLRALDLQSIQPNFESLTPLIRHSLFLQTLNMPYLNAQDMEGFRQCLNSHHFLKDLHFRSHPISSPVYKTKNLIDQIATRNQIPVYIDNRQSEGTLSRLSSFKSRFNTLIFCSSLVASIALCIFLGIKYEISPEYLFMIICGVIFSTCMVLIAQAQLRDQCAKNKTFYPDYEALN